MTRSFQRAHKGHLFLNSFISTFNKDGSESVLLDALPVNGKLQLPTPKANNTKPLET